MRRASGSGRGFKPRVSLALALAAVATIACVLAVGRHYEWFVKKTTVIYAVADLVASPQDDYSSLVASVRSVLASESWGGEGRPDEVSPFFLSKSLIVKTSQAGHQRVMALMRKEREARHPAGRINPPAR